jgi:hypothetical protein
MPWQEITINGKIFEYRALKVEGGFSVQWRRGGLEKVKRHFPIQRVLDQHGRPLLFLSEQQARQAAIDSLTQFALGTGKP